MSDAPFWSALLGALIGGASTFGAAVWQHAKTRENERRRDQNQIARDALLAYVDWFESQEPKWARNDNPIWWDLDPGAVAVRVELFTDGTTRQILQSARFNLLDLPQTLHTLVEIRQVVRRQLYLAHIEAQNELVPTKAIPSQADAHNDLLEKVHEIFKRADQADTDLDELQDLEGWRKSEGH